MAKLNIKKGDNVVVISGKEKGKTGKVLGTVPATNRAVVDGVNIVTKHQKPRSQKDKGGIMKKPAPVEISNLMVVCPVCGKATRVAKKELDGKNTRICKKCGASLDKAFTKAKKEAKKPVEAKEEKTTAKKAVEKKITEKKTTEKVAKKTTTTKSATEKVAVKKSTAKAGASTARRSTNRGK